MGNYAIEFYWPWSWSCDLRQANQKLLLGTSFELNPRKETIEHPGSKVRSMGPGFASGHGPASWRNLVWNIASDIHKERR